MHHSTRCGGSCFLKSRRRGRSRSRIRLSQPPPRGSSRSSAAPAGTVGGHWVQAPEIRRSAVQQLTREAQLNSAPVTSRLQAEVVEVKIGAVSGRCPRKRHLREDALVSRSVFSAPLRVRCQGLGLDPSRQGTGRPRFLNPAVYLVSAPLGGAALLRTRPLRFPRRLPSLQSSKVGPRGPAPGKPGIQEAERRRSLHL